MISPIPKATADFIRKVRSKTGTLTLATGVFDLLHIEHIRFLNAAKKCGSHLLVGLETDARVKSIKGDNRPYNPQEIRLEQVANLKAVDHAFLLPAHFSNQDDWIKLMKAIQPNVYAISSHTSYQENKRFICNQLDIQLKIVHPHNPNISTSKLIASKKHNPHQQ
jgi:cytidyltransferase-like protein